MVCEGRTNPACTLDYDDSPFEVIRSEGMCEAGADAKVDADRRWRSRTPRAAGLDRSTKDVLGSLADDVHVRLTGVHVRARPEGATQRRDEIGITQEQRATLLPAWDLRHRDHRLAAAERKARDGQLPRHRSRKAHRVFQRLGRRPVHLHPGAASRGTKVRRMEAYEDPGTALPVAVYDRRLPVPRLEQLLERRHAPRFDHKNTSQCQSKRRFGDESFADLPS